jgi:hypothetical protein
MLSVGVTIDTSQVEQVLTQLPVAVGRSLLPYSRRVGQTLQRYIQTQKLSGQSLDVRTGASRRAIFYRVEQAVGAGGVVTSQTVVVGGDLKVAPGLRIHEYGGTVTGKPWLAIPLRAAQTPRGVARFRARDLRANPAAYGYTGSFIRNDIIFGKRASGGIVPLFVLKRSVQLKRVGYLAETAREQLSTVIDIYRQATADAVRETDRRAPPKGP